MRVTASGISLLLAGSNARADSELEVTRDSGSQDCPDAAKLSVLATHTLRTQRAAPGHDYQVSFERVGALYSVTIVDETARRMRALRDTAHECGPLGLAAGLVLATMWDSEAAVVSADDAGRARATVSATDNRDATTAFEAPLPARPRAPPPPPPPPAPPREARRSWEATPSAPPYLRRTRWSASAGSGIALGIVRPAAPIILFSGGFEDGRLELALGGIWIPQGTLGLAEGSVDSQLISGEIRACVVPWMRLRLGACASGFAGVMPVGAHGFNTTMQAVSSWLAAGLQAFFEGQTPLAALNYRLAIGAIVPLRAEVLTVAGSGSAYNTPAWGGLLTLALSIGILAQSGRPPRGLTSR